MQKEWVFSENVFIALFQEHNSKNFFVQQQFTL